MATIRKLSTIRQFSFNYESPNLEHRRKSLRKQFSEDFPEKDGAVGDRPHGIKIAWADPNSPKEEGVIAKKCIKGVKKTSKLIRHSSLEKDSILYSKQELADRLRQALQDRSNTKPNLNIFLAHNTQDEDPYEPDPEPPPMPKIIPTLLSLDNTTLFNHKKFTKPNHPPTAPPVISLEDEKDSQAIKDVIIRPSTAAAKRANFQKRATAFNSVIKEAGATASRPPLMRSSSAPTRSDHSEKNKPKFLATKRRIKSGKIKISKGSDDEEDNSNKENPKSKKEMNKFVVINGNEVETMVSLVSPADSENEEVEIETKSKIKPAVVNNNNRTREEKEEGKCVSLRKTVKSVSFQQSSIHAIRSFSASFPARRGSMATTLMLGNGGKNQEKRTTNFTASDDERGPKRRLVRSATEKITKSDEDSETCKEKVGEIETPITVGIKPKEAPAVQTDEKNKTTVEENEDKEEPKFGSEKEKQCWEMYRKMADKGLKVSYDTILRGMLTPTEYRLRRKESIVDGAKNTAIED